MRLRPRPKSCYYGVVDALKYDAATPLPAVEDAKPAPTVESAELLTSREIIAEAKYRDIALRILRSGGHITQAELAREVGIAPATISRALGTPFFQKIYHDAYDEVFGTVDDRIGNERGDSIMRARAAQTRALTMVGELMNATRSEIAAVNRGEKPLRAGIVQAGVALAAEARQVAESLNEAESSKPVTPGQVTINIDNRRAVVLKDTLKESGVDLSDIMGTPKTVDAEVVNEESR